MLMPHSSSVKAKALSRWLALGSQTWYWRRLIGDLAWREFRARYAGSVLGVVWVIAEPAVQFGLYLTVFAVFLGMRLAPGAPVGSFGFYLVTGLVPYLALQETVMRSAALAREQASLVRHVNVPLQVLLAGSLLAVFMRHGVSLALVVVITVVAGTVAWAQLGWLVLACLVLLLAGVGIALLLVPVGAYVPDAVPVLGSALSVIFFLTPIVYPETLLPASISRWLLLNPLVGILDMFRAALIGGANPGLRSAIAALASLVLLVAGSAVFLCRERAVRDIV